MSDLRALRSEAAKLATQHKAAAERALKALELLRAAHKEAQLGKAAPELLTHLDDRVNLAQLVYLQQEHLARAFADLAAGRRAFQ